MFLYDFFVFWVKCHWDLLTKYDIEAQGSNEWNL